MFPDENDVLNGILIIEEGTQVCKCSNLNIKYIFCPKSLIYLDCSMNKLKIFICSDNLSYLICNDNDIRSITFNNKLKHLNCSNNNIEQLCPNDELINLFCPGSHISHVEFTKSLLKVTCSHNNLKNIIVNKGLLHLDCRNNKINFILLPKSIKYLNVTSNPLANISIKGNNAYDKAITKCIKYPNVQHKIGGLYANRYKKNITPVISNSRKIPIDFYVSRRPNPTLYSLCYRLTKPKNKSFRVLELSNCQTCWSKYPTNLIGDVKVVTVGNVKTAKVCIDCIMEQKLIIM